MSENGWINKEICTLWFKHFISSIPPTRPQLLLLDGCSSHISSELALLGKQNDIDILLFPANLTHIMQPLDLTVFGPLKLYLQQEIKSRGFEVHNSTIKRYEICALIAPGYAKAVSPANIISGFKKAGIFPLDSSVILSNPSLLASSIPSRIDESTTVSKGVVADTLETDSDPPSTSEEQK